MLQDISACVIAAGWYGSSCWQPFAYKMHLLYAFWVLLLSVIMITVYILLVRLGKCQFGPKLGGSGREDQVLLNSRICHGILHSVLYILHLSFWLCCMTLP